MPIPNLRSNLRWPIANVIGWHGRTRLDDLLERAEPASPKPHTHFHEHDGLGQHAHTHTHTESDTPHPHSHLHRTDRSNVGSFHVF